MANSFNLKNKDYFFLPITAFMRNKLALAVALSCLFILTEITGQNTYADIHAHICLKPFHSRFVHQYDLWEKIEHECPEKTSAKWMVNRSDGVPKYSQINLEAAAKGNVKVLGLSLVPVEAPMFKLRLLNEQKRGEGTISCISGVSVTSLDFLNKHDIYYFPLLQRNIEFVEYGQGRPQMIDGKTYSYELVRSREHFQELLKDDSKLALVMNIEGGHVLGRSLSKKDISKRKDYQEIVIKNVLRLKGALPLYNWKDEYLPYPIFSLTLNHFYYNGLGGHANPFSPSQRWVFNAGKGVDEPISELGKDVVRTMVDKERGRRIIPDVKHMSWKSRNWYYDYLEMLREQKDTVPVIFSHAAVAGMSETHPKYLKKDMPDKYKQSLFNNWTINLSDEDIMEVHKSNGMIGVMLDRYRLCGGIPAKDFEQYESYSLDRKKVYIKIVAMNMLYIVKTIGDKSAWERMCIGSDFDGMINAFEHYDTAEKFPDLARDLESFFDNPDDIYNLFTKEDIKALMFGYSAKEITNKMMSSNAIEFYIRHFPEKGF